MLLAGGHVIDPGTDLDGRADVRIDGSRIVEVAPNLAPRASEEVLDVAGLLVTPGLIDVHVHLREPGQEAKETIATGAMAAVAGGFTTICAMPNTDPVVDTAELVRYVLERGRVAAAARVLPIAAATRGSRGEEPTDAAALAGAGAVALSDDGRPIATRKILEVVLGNAHAAGLLVADHCEVLELSAEGAVFAGPVAERLGVSGIPAEAESEAVRRDLEVLSRTQGRLHLCHVSTAGSVELLRRARNAGLAVTAEASPHHLTLTAEDVLQWGTLAKMNPPLALETDRDALVRAIAEGTITCIATDHAPHTAADKALRLDAAPFGIVGLETAFALLHTELVRSAVLDLKTLIERLTLGPARAFGLTAGRLAPAAAADVAAFDLEAEWVVEPDGFRSRGRNTPLAGRRLTGRPVLTLVHGRVVHDER